MEALVNLDLFPDITTIKCVQSRLDELLANAGIRVPKGSVVPTINLEKFRSELAQMKFEHRTDIHQVLEWVTSSLESGMVHMTHPRYMGLFNPAPSFPSICADQIAAEFNPQICVWSHAPVAVEIEQHVVEQLASRIGLPDGAGGHFTSGGSEANNTAVVCALTSANPAYAQLGARSFAGQPRIYVSKESHLAWYKIAHQLGIGRDAVVLIPTDGMGRMDAEKLTATVAEHNDRGDVPILVAATAGTTNAGMIDPLCQISSIAKRFDLWFHVDAAWGGALIASEKYRSALDGMQLADSITIDAHKWFASTMGAGIFITRQKSVLSESFAAANNYMPSNDESVDPYVNSIQWSRRFVGLRLFMSLAVAGWAGYAQHLEHCIDMVNQLNGRLTARGWQLLNNSSVAVACLIPPTGSKPIEQIVEHAVQRGRCWVSLTKFEDQPVLRACATNGRISPADIEIVANELIEIANS